MSDFQTILGTLGGPGERERGQQLIARMQVSVSIIIAEIVNTWKVIFFASLEYFSCKTSI